MEERLPVPIMHLNNVLHTLIVGGGALVMWLTALVGAHAMREDAEMPLYYTMGGVPMITIERNVGLLLWFLLGVVLCASSVMQRLYLSMERRQPMPAAALLQEGLLWLSIVYFFFNSINIAAGRFDKLPVWAVPAFFVAVGVCFYLRTREGPVEEARKSE